MKDQKLSTKTELKTAIQLFVNNHKLWIKKVFDCFISRMLF